MPKDLNPNLSNSHYNRNGKGSLRSYETGSSDLHSQQKDDQLGYLKKYLSLEELQELDVFLTTVNKNYCQGRGTLPYSESFQARALERLTG